MNSGKSRCHRAVLLVLAAVVLGGCRGDGERGTTDLDVTLAIAPTPPTVGDARVVVTVADRDGAPVEGAEVALEGNMTHAGMTPVNVDATAEAPGRYVVAAFPFTMSGDWIVTTRVTRAGELLSSHERRVRVVGAEAAPDARGSGGA